MLLIVVLIASALSSSILTQSPSIGSDCTQGTPKFKVYSFTSNPWPITNQLSANLTMNGTFTTPTFISEIWISSSSPNNFENQQVIISKQYPIGNSSIPIYYLVQYPAATWNVILTVRDGGFNILDCWSFSYTSQQ